MGLPVDLSQTLQQMMHVSNGLRKVVAVNDHVCQWHEEGGSSSRHQDDNVGV